MQDKKEINKNLTEEQKKVMFAMTSLRKMIKYLSQSLMLKIYFIILYVILSQIIIFRRIQTTQKSD